MGFFSAIKAGLIGFGEFTGRSPRSEFWWFSLFQFLSVGAVVAYDMSWLIPLAKVDPVAVGAIPWTDLTSSWVSLAFILPMWAVLVRRLHDTDRSGWLALLTFVPFGALVVLFFTILPGTPRRNRFGPDPLADGRKRALPESMRQTGQSEDERRAEIRALYQSRTQNRA